MTTPVQPYTFGDREHVALPLMPCLVRSDVNARPTPLPVIVENIPEAMRAERRWVVWKYEWREGAHGKPGNRARRTPGGDLITGASWLAIYKGGLF